MTTSTEDGLLVLADITGFTAFAAATPLEHGPQIIAALLESVMHRLSPPLEIQEVEGDAVFALAASSAISSPSSLLDLLEGAVGAFRRSQREMEADESCLCEACRGVAGLDLKIVAHHGRFVRHLVGGRGQVAGPDVILAHRLLKNGLVRAPSYVLLTEPAVAWSGIDAAGACLVPHAVRYEHLGDVRCYVRELGRPPALPLPWPRPRPTHAAA